jgi:hypothetical protein
MTFWWIANAALVAVVFPVVVVLTRNVYRRTAEIEKLAGRVLAGGLAIDRDLEAIPKLVATRDLAVVARQRVSRYGAAVERLL